MFLFARAADSQGNGGGSGSDDSSRHNGIGPKVALPIFFIVGALVASGLLAIYRRKILGRSRRPTTRWTARNVSQVETRPTLWEVRLGRPEGGVTLNNLRVS